MSLSNPIEERQKYAKLDSNGNLIANGFAAPLGGTTSASAKTYTAAAATGVTGEDHSGGTLTFAAAGSVTLAAATPHTVLKFLCTADLGLSATYKLDADGTTKFWGLGQTDEKVVTLTGGRAGDYIVILGEGTWATNSFTATGWKIIDAVGNWTIAST